MFLNKFVLLFCVVHTHVQLQIRTERDILIKDNDRVWFCLCKKRYICSLKNINYVKIFLLNAFLTRALFISYYLCIYLSLNKNTRKLCKFFSSHQFCASCINIYDQYVHIRETGVVVAILMLAQTKKKL